MLFLCSLRSIITPNFVLLLSPPWERRKNDAVFARASLLPCLYEHSQGYFQCTVEKTPMGKRKLLVYYFKNLLSYRRALAYQRIVQRHQFVHVGSENAGDSSCDTLFLLQHPSIYTLGRRSKLDNLKFDHAECENGEKDGNNFDIIRVERGGEVTWHGPGQLVGYPIFDLTKHKKDLHWFLRNIEQCVINALGTYGAICSRDDAGTGVWVGDSKIAAIGLSASKWITMHGFSINVHPDLKFFENIVPCGIENKSVTSLDKLMLEGVIPRNENHNTVFGISEIVSHEFSKVFNLELDFIEIDHLEEVHFLLGLNEDDISLVDNESSIESFSIVRNIPR